MINDHKNSSTKHKGPLFAANHEKIGWLSLLGKSSTGRKAIVSHGAWNEVFGPLVTSHRYRCPKVCILYSDIIFNVLIIYQAWRLHFKNYMSEFCSMPSQHFWHI